MGQGEPWCGPDVSMFGQAMTPAAAGPSVTEWISAFSTLTLGVLGVSITFWQWYSSGFRPKLRSRIDAMGEACDLLIINRGRASGIIEDVLVKRPDDIIVEDVVFEGFTRGAFRSLVIPPLSSTRLIIQAPNNAQFDPGITLLVGIGKTKPREEAPKVMRPGIGIYGLESVLPPGVSSNIPQHPCYPVRIRRGPGSALSARTRRMLSGHQLWEVVTWFAGLLVGVI